MKEEKITIKEYNQLSKRKKKDYLPIRKTKEVKEKCYCEYCGHSTGLIKTEREYGKIIGYRIKNILDYINEDETDVFNNQVEKMFENMFPEATKFLNR